MKRFTYVLGTLVIAGAALASWAQAADVPPLTAQPPVLLPRAPGRFDYLVVDDKLHRLLVAHTGSRSFDVVQMPGGTVLRQVDVGEGHGIAVDTKDGKYFVGTSRQPALNDVNRKNLVLQNRIVMPGAIDAVTIDTKSSTIYAVDADSGQIVVLSGKTDKVVATITIGGDLEYIEYDPVADRIYQNIVKPAAVAVIDPSRNAVVANWPAAPAADLRGLAVDGPAHRIFSAGGNGKLVMLDSTNGSVVASADIASGVDQIAYDPGNRRVYCASGTGELSVVQVHDATLESLGSITIPRRTHSVTVDPSTHDVWVAYGAADNDYIMKLVAAPASPVPAAQPTNS